MLLTIFTTHEPATDLGYLLHKNPARVQSFDLSFGKAHVFYPRADASHCTAALLLDVDPVQLVRGRRGSFTLDQYVNDRPYVASSLLSVAISQVFGTALSGRCRDKPELAETRIPLVARLAALPCRGGEAFLRQLFEPLGYTVTATREPLDPRFPEWGEGPYFTVELSGTQRLCDLLDHLYVLVPVLDDEKHYYIGEAEVEKLLKHGEAWLASHPEREAIVKRYLGYRAALTRQALARLPQDEAAAPDDEEEVEDKTAAELPAEKPLRLNDQRLDAVVGELKACGANRVLDLGCSTGNLLRRLLDDGQFTEIVGVDVSHVALDVAARRLHLERLPTTKAQRIKLLHGSLTYRDKRLAGYDAAAIVEVIEHLDPPRLAALERAVFEAARPATVVVTTPNREYNVLFAGMQPGQLRHRDHRFEWTRDEFRSWAARVAERFGYELRLVPIGPEDATHGPPTQMAVFQIGERPV
jgi:3' terminal RNA ribose 2'-O-methyltransferase Hen1